MCPMLPAIKRLFRPHLGISFLNILQIGDSITVADGGGYTCARLRGHVCDAMHKEFATSTVWLDTCLMGLAPGQLLTRTALFPTCSVLTGLSEVRTPRPRSPTTRIRSLSKCSCRRCRLWLCPAWCLCSLSLDLHRGEQATRKFPETSSVWCLCSLPLDLPRGEQATR